MRQWSSLFFLGIVFVGLAYLIHPSQLRLLKNEMDAQDVLYELWGYVQNDSSRLGLLLLAQGLEKNGHYEQSYQVWNRLIQRYPHYDPYYDSLQRRYSWMGLRDSSVKLFLRKSHNIGLNANEQLELIQNVHLLGLDSLKAELLLAEYHQNKDQSHFNDAEIACFDAQNLSCRLELSLDQWQKEPNNPAFYEEYGRLLALSGKRSELKTHLLWKFPPLQSPLAKQRVQWALEWGEHEFALQKVGEIWQQSSTDRLSQLNWLESQNLIPLAELFWSQFVPLSAPDSLQKLYLQFCVRHQLKDIQNKRLMELAQGKGANWTQLAWQNALAQRNWNQALLLEEAWIKQGPQPLRAQDANTLLYVHMQNRDPMLGAWLRKTQTRLRNDKVFFQLLTSAYSPKEQFHWLLNHASGSAPDFQRLDQWLHSRIKQEYSDELFKLGPLLKNSFIASWMTESYLNQNNGDAAKKWLVYAPNPTQFQVKLLKMERDKAWEKRDLKLAFDKQAQIARIQNTPDSSWLLLARDLWWQTSPELAIQAWKQSENLGLQDSMAPHWQAEAPGPWKSKARAQLFEQGLKKGNDLALLKLLQNWQDWELAQKIEPKKLNGQAWWIWIELALDHQAWDKAELALQQHPERRSHIPPSLMQKIKDKAQREWENGKIGDANFWYQMAEGGGW